MRRAAHRLIQPGVVLAVFVLDRVTKEAAMRHLQPLGSIDLLPFFHLTYLENTGAAWGMFRDGNAPLIVVSLLLLAGLFYMKRTFPDDARLAHYGTSLVVGGALGNLYDRITLGAVVDFLDFLVWPVFNAADSAITVGACLLALGLHLADKKKARARP